MRPVTLEMEGFGTFREPCTVDFEDIELVALVGATGSGKSTIIDAITFALYGSVVRYDDNRAVAPVINQTSQRARVRLDFRLGDATYTAVRVVNRTNTGGATTREARLEHGDDVLAADARTMSRVVGELLGLDLEQFNRTVVLPQGRFADFLHDKPADRQATLRQLLGLEVYVRVGAAARGRAAALHAQADALRPDLEDGEQDLTDERRAGLVDRIELVRSAREAFVEAAAELQRASGELATIDARLATVDAHLLVVAEVRAPAGVAELDRRAASADDDVTRAEAAVVAAVAARRSADAAAAVGPDLASCTTDLRRRHEATAAGAELRRAEAQLASAVQTWSDAEQAATTIGLRRAGLVAARDAAATALDAARAALDEGCSHVQLEHWKARRARRVVATSELDLAGSAAGAAAAAVAAVTDRAGAAADAVAAARSVRDDLKDRAGAAAFAGLLTVGAPCPLCLHDVVHLPEHHVSDDLAAAAGRLADAERDLRVVSTELAEVTERAAACRADVASRERELAAIDADLDGVPDDDSLTLLLAAAVARRDAVVSAAAADASAAARLADHDTDPVHVEALAAAACAAAAVTAATAVHETTRHRAELLDAEVAGLPPVGELERSIAEADRLAEGQRRAAASQATAEQARDAAVGTRDEVAAQVRHATSALVAARDRLAPLGPPPADPTRGLAAGWSSLAAWARDAGSILERTRREVAAEREELARRREDIDAAARERCAAVLGWATGDLAGLRDALVRAEEIAGGAVARFDADRERLAILRDRIEHLLTDAAVATELGNRLRVNGFEAWLMRAALEDLVDDATVRLRELSSGQFSLELVDDEFVVRDHANADEVRSARTLSGGETFLASLSLALALADATNELSTATHERSAPAMESIFLDEGFGTLDPGTLDVVAAAIEELGSRGRMVALVTHIRDLADRMPVRLEVTKTGATSRVERVDT